jgi:hypothetical protein
MPVSRLLLAREGKKIVSQLVARQYDNHEAIGSKKPEKMGFIANVFASVRLKISIISKQGHSRCI